MKAPPTLSASAITLVIAGSLALTACSERQQFQDFPAIQSAIVTFSRDRAKQGQPLPPSVPLGDLVSGGYIPSNSVHAFEGVETRIWLTGDPNVLDSVVMSVRLHDGSVSAALWDGSVQHFSAQAFAQHIKKTGQQDGAASGSQPIPPETNSASGAAGSGR